jgi:hypothetical protein
MRLSLPSKLHRYGQFLLCPIGELVDIGSEHSRDDCTHPHKTEAWENLEPHLCMVTLTKILFLSSLKVTGLGCSSLPSIGTTGFFFFSFFLSVLGLELKASTLSIFKIGSQQLFCLGWLWTKILLISASWVASITDVNHRCPARNYIFFF